MFSSTWLDTAVTLPIDDIERPRSHTCDSLRLVTKTIARWQYGCWPTMPWTFFVVFFSSFSTKRRTDVRLSPAVAFSFCGRGPDKMKDARYRRVCRRRDLVSRREKKPLAGEIERFRHAADGTGPHRAINRRCGCAVAPQ